MLTLRILFVDQKIESVVPSPSRNLEWCIYIDVR